MKKSFTLLISIALAFPAFSQQLSQSVISSSGSNYTAGGYTFSETIGEMAAVTTLSGGGTILTQGFQQGLLSFTAINSPDQIENNQLIFYPNPASDELHVEFDGKIKSVESLKVFDAIGKILIDNSATGLSGNASYILDLKTMAPGLYFLSIAYFTVSDEIRTASKSFIIQK